MKRHMIYLDQNLFKPKNISDIYVSPNMFAGYTLFLLLSVHYKLN